MGVILTILWYLTCGVIFCSWIPAFTAGGIRKLLCYLFNKKSDPPKANVTTGDFKFGAVVVGIIGLAWIPIILADFETSRGSYLADFTIISDWAGAIVMLFFKVVLAFGLIYMIGNALTFFTYQLFKSGAGEKDPDWVFKIPLAVSGIITLSYIVPTFAIRAIHDLIS